MHWTVHRGFFCIKKPLDFFWMWFSRTMKYQQSKFRHWSKKKDTTTGMYIYVCICMYILWGYATEENREEYIRQEVARTINNEFSNRRSTSLIAKSLLLKSRFDEYKTDLHFLWLSHSAVGTLIRQFSLFLHFLLSPNTLKMIREQRVLKHGALPSLWNYFYFICVFF